MKKIAKILVMAMAIGLCLGGLGACGKKGERRDGDPKDPTVTSEPTPTDTMAKISVPRKEIGEPEPEGGDGLTEEELLSGEWFTELKGLSCRLTLAKDGAYTVDYPALPQQEKTSGTWALEGNHVLLDGKSDDRLVAGEDSNGQQVEAVIYQK